MCACLCVCSFICGGALAMCVVSVPCACTCFGVWAFLCACPNPCVCFLVRGLYMCDSCFVWLHDVCIRNESLLSFGGMDDEEDEEDAPVLDPSRFKIRSKLRDDMFLLHRITCPFMVPACGGMEGVLCVCEFVWGCIMCSQSSTPVGSAVCSLVNCPPYVIVHWEMLRNGGDMWLCGRCVAVCGHCDAWLGGACVSCAPHWCLPLWFLRGLRDAVTMSTPQES